MSDTSVEIWKPVVGFEGLYEVSNLAKVRSLDKIIPTKGGARKLHRGQVLKTSPGRLGYPQMTLCDRESSRHQRFLHSVVAQAFLGPADGRVVRHLDDDRSNTALDNLAYGTFSDNANDAVRNGVHPSASKTHCPNGHSYSGANLYEDPNGYRRCRECKRNLDRNRRAARWSTAAS